MRTPLTLLLLTAAACNIQVGSGTAASDTRNLEPSSALRVSTALDVQITQGDLDVATVTCDDNLLSAIFVGVREGVLEIGLMPDVSIAPTTDCSIDLMMTSLPSELEFSGSGSILFANPLSLSSVDMSGSGELELAEGTTACGLEIATSGSGQINLGTLHGCGVTFATSGSGTITAEGSVDAVEINTSGSGPIELRDLTTKTAEIALSGSGQVELHVTESVVVNTSGSGAVVIYGQPADQVVNASGTGSVQFE